MGFISEASLFVECLSFDDKLSYLAVAGTVKPRPSPDLKAVARFKAVAELGARLLHAPHIGAEIFIEGFQWADDDVYTMEQRQQRFSDLAAN